MLHNISNNDTEVALQVKRGDQAIEKKIAINAGWKNGHFMARFALVSHDYTGLLVRPDKKGGCKKTAPRRGDQCA